MTRGNLLYDKLRYMGMLHDTRKLALTDKLATAEELAVMTEAEVCDLICERYEMVFAQDETVGLVNKDDIPAYNKLVKLIKR